MNFSEIIKSKAEKKKKKKKKTEKKKYFSENFLRNFVYIHQRNNEPKVNNNWRHESYFLCGIVFNTKSLHWSHY